MFPTVIVSIISIIISYFSKFKELKNSLFISFMILTIFMSIRYDFGNDYMSYLQTFLDISKYEGNIELRIEYGWLFLNKIFIPIGFFSLIIFLTVFEYFTLYKLIKTYVPVELYWLSVFSFCFNISFMLIGVSMMRQFLAMCIFVQALKFILEKKIIISLILVFLASTFHKSALILLPFVFIGYLNFTITTKKALLIFLIFLLLYFIGNTILSSFFQTLLSNENFSDYENYTENIKAPSKGPGLGFVFRIFLLLLTLLYQKYQSKEVKIIFVIYLFNFLFIFFSEIAPMTIRLGYYFRIFEIICFPLLFISVRNFVLKYLLLLSYIIIVIKEFFIDFYDPSGVFYKKFIFYKTIFSIYEWF